MAKDPFMENLNIARAQKKLAAIINSAEGEPEGDADAPKRGPQISPKLTSLSVMLAHGADRDLSRVTAHNWRVMCSKFDESEETIYDPDTKEVAGSGVRGYVPCMRAIAVQQCMPDVLGHLQRQGIEGMIELRFEHKDKPGEFFTIETTLEPAPLQAEPRAVNPNAGLPEMMAMFMAQQERQSQMLLAAVAKMTEKSSQTEREWQRKLEEANQRHAQQMQDMLNRQAAQYQGDKRLQIGGAIEQSFLQATNMAVERTFANMLNPQQPAPQQGAMPGMGMATTPTQMMAQMVQGLKADAEARRVLAQELPGLVGEAAKAPEPTIFEYAQQIIPVFMLLKNMSGKDPNQLENAMRQFAQMRQGPAANVNPITGMPIPDAAPADGDAALAQIAANLG